MDPWKFIEGSAVIIWGVVSVILLFILALHTGAFFAACGAVVVAGLTYIFQAVVLATDTQTRRGQAMLGFGNAVIIVVFAFSFLLLLGGK